MVQEIKIDKIIRSQRKTIALEITPELKLIIRAPYHVTRYEIENIVKKKEHWIKKTTDRIKTTINRNQTYKISSSLKDGNLFLLFGSAYRIKIGTSKKNHISIKNGEININVKENSNPKNLIVKWCKKILRDYIDSKVKEISKLTGLYPNKILITSAKKRWGSCSGKNNLNFTWRLVMAPKEIIDYVVIHEIFHIKEKNHSKRFWNHVESLISDYKEKRNWLKENVFLLRI